MLSLNNRSAVSRNGRHVGASCRYTPPYTPPSFPTLLPAHPLLPSSLHAGPTRQYRSRCGTVFRWVCRREAGRREGEDGWCVVCGRVSVCVRVCVFMLCVVFVVLRCADPLGTKHSYIFKMLSYHKFKRLSRHTWTFRLSESGLSKFFCSTGSAGSFCTC